MKNFFKVVFSRAVFTGVFIALQFAAIFLAVTRFNEHFALFASVGMMLLAKMPVYALGYDERCRWERYALAMPVRKSDLFWSRFLLGVIAIALGAAVQVLVALLAGRGDLLSSLAVTAPAAILYLLIVLPLMMKLGVEKGRFLLLLLTAAFTLLSGLIA